MYIGEAMLLDVSPSEVICDNIDNITFETPFEVQLGDEEGVSVYITLKLEDTKFAPDIIVAALLEWKILYFKRRHKPIEKVS